MGKILSLNKEDNTEDVDVVWECGACGNQVKRGDDPGSGPVGINLGGLPVFVCNVCGTFSVPKEMIEELKKMVSQTPQNIVVPDAQTSDAINKSNVRI